MDLFDTIRMSEDERRRYRDGSVLDAELAALKKEQGPAGRLLPERTKEIQEARNRKPEPVPEQTPRIAEAKPQEAERMAYRPTGLQRAPSPGGGNYVNPRAHNRAAAIQDRQQGEGLIDQLQRQRKAVQATITPAQRNAERQLNDELRRQREQDNSRTR